VALVEASGERTFITTLGAESLPEPGAWELVRVRPGDAVYVSGYGLVPPESGRVLGAWAASLPPGVLLFADPGPLVADIPAAVLDPVLARCDWWSCNQREAALLTGLTADDAARRANAAAALTVTRAGAATSPTRAELDRFLRFRGS
jgi:sugar/nucleoside kinase (ribokinase family)